MYSYLVGRANPCICIWSEEQIHVLGLIRIRLYLLVSKSVFGTATVNSLHQLHIFNNFCPKIKNYDCKMFVFERSQENRMNSVDFAPKFLRNSSWESRICTKNKSDCSPFLEYPPPFCRPPKRQIHVFTPKTKSMYSYLVRGANPCIWQIRICPNPIRICLGKSVFALIHVKLWNFRILNKKT